MAAKQLGGNAWELSALPEPDRTFWVNRGLLWARSEADAWNEDEMDRRLDKPLR